MSSIFSDPGWRRGATLLSGELIELNGDLLPVAGSEIVGQVKVFQDVQPSTGVRYSNRLVYAVGARYKGADCSGDTLAGKVVAFDAGSPLAEFSAVADTTTGGAGRAVGVVDEYLTPLITVRNNDVVWVVVKGPVTVSKTTAAAIAPGVAVEITGTAGAVQTTSGSGRIIGHNCTAGVTTTTSASASSGATTVTVTSVAGISAGQTVSGTNIAAGTTVSSVNTSTKVVTLGTATSGSVSSGASLVFGANVIAATTTLRVNLIGDSI
jgi:hypothetical protein